MSFTSCWRDCACCHLGVRASKESEPLFTSGAGSSARGGHSRRCARGGEAAGSAAQSVAV